MLPFALFYWFFLVVNAVPATLGLCFPFGILGDWTPFYSSSLGHNVPELLVMHCARMCFALSLTLGVILFALRHEPLRLRAITLFFTCIGTALYSSREWLIDVPLATRLGLDLDADTHPRAVQFLVGALHGSTPQVITVIAIVGAIVAAHALHASTTKQQTDPPSNKQD
jgi:hypothetical protein